MSLPIYMSLLPRHHPFISNGSRKFRASGYSANILDLPIETLCRIVGRYLSIDDNRLWNLQPAIQERLWQRSKVLRALSQTCSFLRAVFLPILWERLDWCFKYPGESKWFEILSETTKAKSLGLLSRPDLGVHVRVANLSLTGCSAHLVFPILAKCLASLPHLYTINIVDSTLVGMPNLLREAFTFKLPSVRKLTIPTLAINLLKSCPNVKTLVCTDLHQDNDMSKFLGAFRVCRRIEVLIDFLPTEATIKRVVRAVANLRFISFKKAVPNSVIEELGLLTQLEEIEFIWHSPDDVRDKELDRCVTVAYSVLQNGDSIKVNKAVRLVKKQTMKVIEDGLEYWRVVETSVDVFSVINEDTEQG